MPFQNASRGCHVPNRLRTVEVSAFCSRVTTRFAGSDAGPSAQASPAPTRCGVTRVASLAAKPELLQAWHCGEPRIVADQIIDALGEGGGGMQGVRHFERRDLRAQACRRDQNLAA